MANDVIMTDDRWLLWSVRGLEHDVLQRPICWLRGNVAYIDGCLLVTTKATWERLGGLAADTYIHPGYWSDVDLCWRASLLVVASGRHIAVFSTLTTTPAAVARLKVFGSTNSATLRRSSRAISIRFYSIGR